MTKLYQGKLPVGNIQVPGDMHFTQLTPWMSKNIDKILTHPETWVNYNLLVLHLQTPKPIRGTSSELTSIKNRFLRLSIFLQAQISMTLKSFQQKTEAIDPDWGLLFLGGEPNHPPIDYLAVAKYSLGFVVEAEEGCGIAYHPSFSRSFYPSMMITTASKEQIELAMGYLNQFFAPANVA